jgi:glucan-binding YG repeat protein
MAKQKLTKAQKKAKIARVSAGIIAGFLAILMVLSMVIPALAATTPDSGKEIEDYIDYNDPKQCWTYVDGHYKYRVVTGGYLTSSWVRYLTDDADERWYVDADGNMVVNDYYKIDGLWYLFGSDGKEVTKQWVQRSDGTWLYSDGDGRLPSGWKTIAGKDYLFDDNFGTMRTGWVQENDTYYFLLDSGAKAYGWVESDGSWYYMDPNDDGKMTVGDKVISGKKYHFDWISGELEK